MFFKYSKKEKCFLLIIVILLAVSFYDRLWTKYMSIPSQDQEIYIPLIKFESCKNIPPPPKDARWPEEAFEHGHDIDDLLELADPVTSRAWIEGKSRVKLGDKIHVTIQLRDARGNRRHKGGDLIRVWMREATLDAASVANVLDHGNGSYSAELKALWVGRPEVRVAIISPSEVIAAVFRRRLVCPPVLMNSGIFKHPVDNTVTEETPCSYDAHVPGYDSICNFTEENYRRPWYCGKPRHPRLMCADWMMVADVNLWMNGYEQPHLSQIDQALLSTQYSSKLLAANITLDIVSNDGSVSTLVPNEPCGIKNWRLSWNQDRPSGYLYQRKWFSTSCRSHFPISSPMSCLNNTRIKLIGDSTSRQIFSIVQNMTQSKWITDSWSQGLKHRPAMCANTAINFSLSLELPPLPFCTRDAPRHFFKSFTANLNSINSNERVIVVLHTFSHLLNYHSHLFYETLKDMRSGIVSLLNRNKNAYVVIKGPHAFSFSKSPDHVIWMPDVYSDIYSQFIYNEFKDISDRVLYINALEITIATEQWHIHAQDYIIQQLVSEMFDFIC